MYANVRGLADVLVRTGAIEDTGVFEDFMRGFTRGKTLFDFVDVGAGKDRADQKIIGKSLRLLVAWMATQAVCLRLLIRTSPNASASTNTSRIAQDDVAKLSLPSPSFRLLPRQWVRPRSGGVLR
jgi:hypothetical protein